MSSDGTKCTTPNVTGTLDVEVEVLEGRQAGLADRVQQDVPTRGRGAVRDADVGRLAP